MFVPTRASLLKNKSADFCETIVFETKKQKKSSSSKLTLGEKTLSSGFKDSKMKQSKIALAVSLGAKPPKRKAENYKDILAKKKQEKDNLEEMDDLNTNMYKKREMKGKRKKEVQGLLSNYGRVEFNKE